MSKATQFIRRHIAGVVIVAIALAVPFGIASAKYTATLSIASNITVKVEKGYTLDKEKLTARLVTLINANGVQPTTVKFVAGNNSEIASLTATHSGVGVHASNSDPIGTFVSADGSTIYVAPMKEGTTSPATNATGAMFAPEDSSSLLANLTGITTVDLSNLDVSKVTNMSLMFSGNSSLTALNLSGFNTKAVTTMANMFDGCDKLQTVTLGSDFVFKGTDGYLPAQTDANITGADGKWYDGNTGYKPAELAALTRTGNVTYSAIAPTV